MGYKMDNKEGAEDGCTQHIFQTLGREDLGEQERGGAFDEEKQVGGKRCQCSVLPAEARRD